jgi:hypothetical protein
MIPFGLAGVAIGIDDAISGPVLPGELVAVVSLPAASLAVVKLRSTHHWPFD